MTKEQFSELEKIGRAAGKWRKEHGYYQEVIAFDTGYAKSSISAFECGHMNNAIILAWYVERGFVCQK